MTNEEAIKVLLDEWKCIDRNDGINCDRKCESCDLVMDSFVLKDAYNMAIKALEQEPTDENLHREREQAYMQGYEDASKRFRQEPSGDLIQRQAVLETLDDMDYVLDEDRTIENYKELLKECYEVLPPVRPQDPKIGHWVKTPKAVMGEGYMWYCDKCEHQVYQDSSRSYPSEKYCPYCGARMVEEQESEVQDADSN